MSAPIPYADYKRKLRNGEILQLELSQERGIFSEEELLAGLSVVRREASTALMGEPNRGEETDKELLLSECDWEGREYWIQSTHSIMRRIFSVYKKTRPEISVEIEHLPDAFLFSVPEVHDALSWFLKGGIRQKVHALVTSPKRETRRDAARRRRARSPRRLSQEKAGRVIKLFPQNK